MFFSSKTISVLEILIRDKMNSFNFSDGSFQHLPVACEIMLGWGTKTRPKPEARRIIAGQPFNQRERPGHGQSEAAEG